MRLPLKTVRFILFIAISSLFISSVSAEDVLEHQLIEASKNGDINKVKQFLEQKNNCC